MKHIPNPKKLHLTNSLNEKPEIARQVNGRIRNLGNENRKDEETIMPGIFYNSKLPGKLKKDLDKKLKSRETQTLIETTEIRNKTLRINFRNKAILLNNIGGQPIKRVKLEDNGGEVCEGIVGLDESRQAKLEVVKNKIPELGSELKQTHLTQL